MPILTICYYSDAYILLKGIITITNTAAANVDLSSLNNIVIIKNCASFNNGINETKNTQVDNNEDLDILILMYNLIEYSHSCGELIGSLHQN